MLDETLNGLEPLKGPIPENARPEYGRAYREKAKAQKAAVMPEGMTASFKPSQPGRQEAVILGSAGQRILTAGEILCLAGLSAGLNVTQKNDYNITVLVGPSVSELILSPEKIDYTGITIPTAVIALAPEGVARRKDLFPRLTPESLVIQASGVEIPATQAKIVTADFKGQGLKPTDWAIAALGVLAGTNRILTREMLDTALAERFKGEILSHIRKTVMAPA